MSKELKEAFPDVDPGAEPLGARVLLQIRTPKKKVGSILMVSETQEVEKWNTTVAKVIKVGDLAFKRREDLSPWPEGAWCKPGDFVRCQKYGGDRWEVQIPGGQPDETALFIIVKDLEIMAKVTGDPLTMKAYI